MAAMSMCLNYQKIVDIRTSESEQLPLQLPESTNKSKRNQKRPESKSDLWNQVVNLDIDMKCVGNCQDHVDKGIAIWCRECDIGICSTCVTDEHSEHNTEAYSLKFKERFAKLILQASFAGFKIIDCEKEVDHWKRKEKFYKFPEFLFYATDNLLPYSWVEYAKGQSSKASYQLKLVQKFCANNYLLKSRDANKKSVLEKRGYFYLPNKTDYSDLRLFLSEPSSWIDFNVYLSNFKNMSSEGSNLYEVDHFLGCGKYSLSLRFEYVKCKNPCLSLFLIMCCNQSDMKWELSVDVEVNLGLTKYSDKGTDQINVVTLPTKNGAVVSNKHPEMCWHSFVEWSSIRKYIPKTSILGNKNPGMCLNGKIRALPPCI